MNTIKSLIITVFLVITAGLAANELPRYSKVILNEQADISQGALLKVKNKYGNITCSNWNQQAIAIKVTLNVDAGSQKEADRLLNSVSVDYHEGSSLVEAETKIGNLGQSRSNSSISVDYQIMMPATVKIDLDNSFGAIILDEVQEKAIILSSYGSFTANKLAGKDNRISVEFGKGKLYAMKSGSLIVKYSTFILNQAEQVTGTFKYSDLETESITLLEIDIEGGKLKAGNIKTLTGSSKFTDIKVNSVTGLTDLDIEYGNINISEIKPEAAEVKINSRFSGTKLGISPENTYKVSAETHFGDFTYPRQIANFTNIEKTPTKSTYEGSLGNGKKITRLQINAEYGGVKIELINTK